MSYRIKQKESMEESVQRIAREQTNKAIAELDDGNLDAHAAVHQVRKRCKKIRGLIRLVRPEFKVYSLENAWYRDSARPLSYVRDAQSIIDTLDKLLDHFTDELDRPAFSPVRRRLTERRKEIMQDEVALHERLAEFSDRMREGRERVAAWRLQEVGFEAVEEGIAKTYRRGRDAMQTAFQKPRSARFHEWRSARSITGITCVFCGLSGQNPSKRAATKSIGWRVSWGTTMICRSCARRSWKA